MRVLLVLTAIVLDATTAGAAGRAIVVDASTLPPRCRWAATVPAGSPAYVKDAAVTSAANCRAIVQLWRPVKPSQADARSLADSLAPTMAMLDVVIRRGDVGSRIIAQHAKADLLAGIATKIAGSVERVGTMTGRDLATFQTRADYAYAVGQPWRNRAVAAFREVTRLGNRDDARKLAERNAVVAIVVDRSRAATAPVLSRR
jgi:hypothetical protein